jgi:uncharacterized protein (UPF0335 family)
VQLCVNIADLIACGSIVQNIVACSVYVLRLVIKNRKSQKASQKEADILLNLVSSSQAEAAT